jgi:hypothetical protein
LTAAQQQEQELQRLSTQALEASAARLARTLSQPPLQPVERESRQHGKTKETKAFGAVEACWVEAEGLASGGKRNRLKEAEFICVDDICVNDEQMTIAQVTEQYYELLEESEVEDWRQLLQDIETLSPESR